MAFDEAVRRSLENHPVMAQAKADVARADAQLEQARAPSLPTLGVNAVGTQLDADRQLGGRTLAYQTSLSGNVQLQVPLVAANRWAAWRRADANADVNQQRHAGTAVSRPLRLAARAALFRGPRDARCRIRRGRRVAARHRLP